jgi:hypothetical protein
MTDFQRGLTFAATTLRTLADRYEAAEREARTPGSPAFNRDALSHIPIYSLGPAELRIVAGEIEKECQASSA